MKPKLALAILLSVGVAASAHRLDEYLQATIISIEKDRIDVFMRLIPGVAVSSTVLASIDTNADGVLSEIERHAYAETVLRDSSLTIDGNRLKLRLLSVEFPTIAEMKDGTGEIQMEFSTDLPAGGSNRKLIFENHHQNQIAAYLVNCLVPRVRNTRVLAQKRNENQSFYQLELTQADVRPKRVPLKWWSGFRAGLGIVGLLLLAGLTFLWQRRGFNAGHKGVLRSKPAGHKRLLNPRGTL
jgi:hypothetical protein